MSELPISIFNFNSQTVRVANLKAANDLLKTISKILPSLSDAEKQSVASDILLQVEINLPKA